MTAGVAFLGWRLAKAPAAGDVLAQQQAAAEIAARARVNAPSFGAGGAPGADGAAAESPELAPVAPDDVEPDGSLAQWDPSPEEPFAELEAEEKLTPVITSVADFYHVSKNITDPVVDGAGWTLTIGGLVETPLTFTYEEIVARAKTQNITTLCLHLQRAQWRPGGHGGVDGRTAARAAGRGRRRPDAVDIVKFRAADDYDDSIPLAQAMRPDHPARDRDERRATAARPWLPGAA